MAPTKTSSEPLPGAGILSLSMPNTATCEATDTEPEPDGLLEAALIGAEETLAFFRPTVPLEFSFLWRRRPVNAAVLLRDGVVLLRLVTELGELPFTAQDRDHRGRLLELAWCRLPPLHGSFAIRRHGRLTHALEIPLEPPITGAVLVTAATQCLLRLAPYLGLAEA